MKAFQKFDPAGPVSELPEAGGAAKAPKAAKAQEFRQFQPPKAHLTSAKAGVTLGGFSRALGAETPQEASALAALGALAGVPCEKSRVTHTVLLQAPDGVPADWVQGVADLLVMPPHPDWPEPRWKTLQQDALAFLGDWAAQASAFGWDPLNLFAVHGDAPRARLDGMGLVPLLDGRPVVAITEAIAAIAASSGGTLTYCRKGAWPPGCRLIWDLEGWS